MVWLVVGLSDDHPFLPFGQTESTMSFNNTKFARSDYTHPVISAVKYRPTWITDTLTNDQPKVTAMRSTSNFFQPENRLPVSPIGGTSIAKYQPTYSRDTVMKNLLSTSVNTILHSITAMNEYECQSFEELRLQDYLANRKGDIVNRNIWPLALKQDARNEFGTISPFMVTNDMDMVTNEQPNCNAIIHSILAMEEYEGVSLEELRLQDYLANRKGPLHVAVAANGNFKPEPERSFPSYSNVFDKIHQPASTAVNVSGIFNTNNSVFPQPENMLSVSPNTGTSIAKYQPTISTDTIIKNWVPTVVNTKLHSITAMNEYKCQSFEELRLQDYFANRKGPRNADGDTWPLAVKQGASNEFGRSSPFSQIVPTTANVLANINSTGFGQPVHVSGWVNCGTLRTKYQPTMALDTLIKDSQENILLHSITVMEAYQNKSFEELRMDYYMANPRGLLIRDAIGSGHSDKLKCFVSIKIDLFGQNTLKNNDSQPLAVNNIFGANNNLNPFETSSVFRPLNQVSFIPQNPSTAIATVFGQSTVQQTQPFRFGQQYKYAFRSDGNINTASGAFSGVKPATEFQAPFCFGQTSTAANPDLLGNMTLMQHKSEPQSVHQSILSKITSPYGDNPIYQDLNRSDDANNRTRSRNLTFRSVSRSNFKVHPKSSESVVRVQPIDSAYKMKSLFESLNEKFGSSGMDCFKLKPNAKCNETASNILPSCSEKDSNTAQPIEEACKKNNNVQGVSFDMPSLEEAINTSPMESIFKRKNFSQTHVLIPNDNETDESASARESDLNLSILKTMQEGKLNIDKDTTTSVIESSTTALSQSAVGDSETHIGETISPQNIAQSQLESSEHDLTTRDAIEGNESEMEKASSYRLEKERQDYLNINIDNTSTCISDPATADLSRSAVTDSEKMTKDALKASATPNKSVSTNVSCSEEVVQNSPVTFAESKTFKSLNVSENMSMSITEKDIDLSDESSEMRARCESISSNSSNSEFVIIKRPEEKRVRHNTTGINLKRKGYYTIPSLEELQAYVAEDGSCIVPHFIIGREGYGQVSFDSGAMDVAGLNLDKIVYFRKKEIIIYLDDDEKPPLGQGLNRAATVTLYQVWPSDKDTEEPITDPQRLAALDWTNTLRTICEVNDTHYIGYTPENGSWIFRVKHF